MVQSVGYDSTVEKRWASGYMKRVSDGISSNTHRYYIAAKDPTRIAGLRLAGDETESKKLADWWSVENIKEVRQTIVPQPVSETRKWMTSSPFIGGTGGGDGRRNRDKVQVRLLQDDRQQYRDGKDPRVRRNTRDRVGASSCQAARTKQNTEGLDASPTALTDTLQATEIPRDDTATPRTRVDFRLRPLGPDLEYREIRDNAAINDLILPQSGGLLAFPVLGCVVWAAASQSSPTHYSFASGDGRETQNVINEERPARNRPSFMAPQNQQNQHPNFYVVISGPTCRLDAMGLTANQPQELTFRTSGRGFPVRKH
ncbi:hypothetical protein C8R43DRAFT_1113126 [Mycena crocata]|nr:hypothetical protein C8R43DRAFT_1113126 [Mycena crocata]